MPNAVAGQHRVRIFTARTIHWIIWCSLFHSVFSFAEHTASSGEARSKATLSDAMLGVSRVVERQPAKLLYPSELSKLGSLSASERVKKLREILAGTEWTCREDKVERGVDAVAALLRAHPEWEKELVEAREKSFGGDVEVLAEYLGGTSIFGGAKSLSSILALTREIAAAGSEQEQKISKLLMENSAWVPERSEPALSYLAQSAKEPLKEPALSHRRTALLRLAVSGSEVEREIYRQLVFGLPAEVFSDLQKFTKEKIPGADGCEWMRLGQKTKDVLVFADEVELAGPILSRVISDPSLDLAAILEKHPALHEPAVPQLLAIEEHQASRAKELGSKLSPEAQLLLSTMRMHTPRQVLVGSLLPPLSSFAAEPTMRNRPRAPTTAAEISELLQETGWYCGSWGWDSNQAVGHEALEAEPKLKESFIKLYEKISQNEFALLLQHWRAGEMGKSELVSRLERHSDRYWVTDSAARAREILIRLESNPDFKQYLQAEHERVTKGTKGKAMMSLELVTKLGARGQPALMRMPKDNRDHLLELLPAVSADERATLGCILPVLDQRLKAGDLAALEIRESISSVEELLSFVKVEPGEFWMGTKGDSKSEIYHEVKITKAFELQKTEVTQSLYQKVMGQNPSSLKGALFPVTDLSLMEVKKFVDALNAHPTNQTAEGKRKYLYRLPSEAQWEYAARGGQKAPKENTLFAHGNDQESLIEYAHFFFEGGTRPVGIRKPNLLGLYDMAGNAAERVEDSYFDDATEAKFDEAYGTPVNHQPSQDGVIRGGGYFDDAQNLRSAYRTRGHLGARTDSLGFRLERTPVP